MNESPSVSAGNEQVGTEVPTSEKPSAAAPSSNEAALSGNPEEAVSSQQTSGENLDQREGTNPMSRVMDRWHHWWEERKTRRVEAKLDKAERNHQASIEEADNLRVQAEQHLALKMKRIEALAKTLGEEGARQARRQVEEEVAALKSQAATLDANREKRAPKLAELRQRDSKHQQALQTLEQRINKPFELKQAGYRAEVQKIEEVLMSYSIEIKNLEAQWEKVQKRQEELKKEMRESSSSQEKSLKKQEGKKLKEENEKRLNWIMKLKNETVELTDRRKHLNYQILMLEYRKAKRRDAQPTVNVGKLLS